MSVPSITDSVDMDDHPDELGPQHPQASLQSKELEQLLDVIDRLRAQGISRFIDLPQMIVCGDQSSGKSSVLEAVSGIRFPTKDNLCTRFPTELILRRGPHTSTQISIVPDINRTEEEKSKLNEFKAGSEALNDFGAIVDRAGQAMGLQDNFKVFSNDVLRVELTGPKMPHLTLVDLPGLFHAGNRTQSSEDSEAIKDLVTRYMKKARSIILAVVSAKNDYANQIVTKYARDVDPEGERTLGIITKPDTLDADSESEKLFFELAENKDVKLRLGWHVLKNRDFNTKNCSDDERNEAEAAFFAEGIWTSLPSTQLGIGSLKPRLGRVLRDQILTELPSLTKDVEAGIKDCEARLERLGASRGTQKEQRLYLHQISQDFTKIVRDAVDGHYSDEYFDDSSSASYPKRIRAVIANLEDQFATKMRINGHQFLIRDDIEPEIAAEDDSGCDRRQAVVVSREKRLQRVAELIKENRGRELPGFVKFETVTTLFREQCRPWEYWIKRYAGEIFDQVRLALHLALDHAADQTTKEGILRTIVHPALDDIKAALDQKVNQNLQQHVKGHPITFNHYFTDNIQKLRNKHQAKALKTKLCNYFEATETEKVDSIFVISSLSAYLTNDTEADMNKFTCSEALYYMEAYYKVALKFFIDDFCIHSIEEGLLRNLPTILDPSKVLALDDMQIADIAGETDESRAERASSSTKLAALREAHKLLRQLGRSHS